MKPNWDALMEEPCIRPLVLLCVCLLGCWDGQYHSSVCYLVARCPLIVFVVSQDLCFLTILIFMFSKVLKFMCV